MELIQSAAPGRDRASRRIRSAATRGTFLFGILGTFASDIAIAQTSAAPAFVKCAWQDGRLPRGNEYRIAPGEWSYWNSSERTWHPMPCEAFDTPTCRVEISDAAYVWNVYEGIQGPGGVATIRKTLSIGRVTGAARWEEYTFRRFPDVSPLPVEEKVTNWATCEKSENPALKPKPVPKL